MTANELPMAGPASWFALVQTDCRPERARDARCSEREQRGGMETGVADVDHV